MKKKLKKSLVLLLIMLILSTYNTASAHTHDYAKTYGVTYFDKGNDYHEKMTFENGICPCGDSYTKGLTYTSQAHSYPSYSYSGYNYHSGTKHVFEFARSCTYCSHRDSYTTSRSCSGPPCTIPY